MMVVVSIQILMTTYYLPYATTSLDGSEAFFEFFNNKRRFLENVDLSLKERLQLRRTPTSYYVVNKYVNSRSILSDFRYEMNRVSDV
jgi:hypothetical protein